MLQENFQFPNQGAGTTAFNVLIGGRYLFTAHATWGGGSAKVQKLALDGATYVDLLAQYNNAGVEQNVPMNALTADGSIEIGMTPGAYQLNIATASAVYAEVARIPLD